MAGPQTHALYRFYGAGGTLLYIGITNSIPVRLRQHNNQKAWWLGVNNITVEHFPSREAVLEAERRAIVAERPLYNDTHNKAGRWGADGETRTAAASRLVAVCMGCGEEVLPGMGALHILEQEALAVYDYEKRRDREAGYVGIDVERFLAGPHPVNWQVHCDWCNPHLDPETNEICPSCYAIDVGRCSSWAQLVDWTAHLMEKPWVEGGTDWLEFIRAIARGAEGAGFVALPATEVAF